MKFLIPLTLFAMALFGSGNAIVTAQDDAQSRSDLELAQALEIKRKVEADLAALQKAKKEQQPQKKSNRKKQNDEIEVDGSLKTLAGIDEKQIEAWAEKHAGEWESWAERFEQKMEKWAEGQEKEWEKWADTYSEQWENWAEEIESGEIKPEEIQNLLEKNLKMLSEMPLGEMIDGGLKEGLGELKNMPIESLGELHELVGSSLEQALGAMEKEIAGVAAAEIKNALGELETGELKKAIGMLQNSIQVQQRQIDDSAKKKIMELKELLKNKDELNEEQLAEVTSALEQEIADAIALSKKQAERERKPALKQRGKAAADRDAIRSKQEKAMRELFQRNARDVESVRAKAEAVKAEALAEQAELMAKKAEALNKAAMADAMSKAKSKMADQSKTKLDQYFSKLKAQQENLKEKESEIEAMRREIRELRKEVERMKQDKD